MEFKKDLLAGAPAAFGYRVEEEGVYVWRCKNENGVQTNMNEDAFKAMVREAGASDTQFLSFSADDPYRISLTSAEIKRLLTAWE